MHASRLEMNLASDTATRAPHQLTRPPPINWSSMESTLNDIRNLLDRGSFKNEEHIRVCVVIRILQELGWNVWSPEEVNLEFAVAPDEDNTKVDVAIRSGPSQLVAFIEVKALGQLRSKLSDIERQLRDYNRNNTAMFTLITDGAEWRFYYSLTGGEFAQKCFKVLNLRRESVEDVQLAFKSLLGKTEIQNGNAERQAVAYLRLTQKQRLMEEFLPEARRKALESPFPSLPTALAELVSEQNVKISTEDTSAFLREFQERRPNSPATPIHEPRLEQKRPAVAPPRIEKNQHQLDPKNPGDLRFTKITEGRIGLEHETGWSDLVKAGIRIAQAKGISFHDLKRHLSINIREEPLDQNGFRWEPELKLSIQGFEARKAAETIFRLAKLTSEELYVKFYWRETEGAAHPGEDGVIHWRP